MFNDPPTEAMTADAVQPLRARLSAGLLTAMSMSAAAGIKTSRACVRS
jgi:hypothetical protein